MIVDDDPGLLSGFGNLLSRAGFDVREVGSGRDALSRGEEFLPQVALIDMWLPDMRGVQVRDALSHRLPACKFVFMTGAGKLEDAISALRNGGALDFLLKPIEPDALVKVVDQAVQSGPESACCPLTDREREVLGLVAEGQDTAGVAQRLCISVQTVKNHLRNVFTKLDVRERTHAVAMGLRAGWL